MINKLVRDCNDFYIKAMELDPELAEKTVQETGQDLITPTSSDQIDAQILMRRALSALSKKDIPVFVKAMKSLDKFLRDFKHESFDEDFYDFASDQDLWDWIYVLQNKQLNNHDWALIGLIRDNLSYLISKPKLFK